MSEDRAEYSTTREPDRAALYSRESLITLLPERETMLESLIRDDAYNSGGTMDKSNVRLLLDLINKMRLQHSVPASDSEALSAEEFNNVLHTARFDAARLTRECISGEDNFTRLINEAERLRMDVADRTRERDYHAELVDRLMVRVAVQDANADLLRAALTAAEHEQDEIVRSNIEMDKQLKDIIWQLEVKVGNLKAEMGTLWDALDDIRLIVDCGEDMSEDFDGIREILQELDDTVRRSIAQAN